MYYVTSYNKFNNELHRNEYKNLYVAEYEAKWKSQLKFVKYVIITDDEFNRFGFYENGKRTGD